MVLSIFVLSRMNIIFGRVLVVWKVLRVNEVLVVMMVSKYVWMNFRIFDIIVLVVMMMLV